VKKIASAVALAIILLAAPSMAWSPDEYPYRSGVKTADALVLSGGGYFHQILITPDGTNAVTVAFYDNTSAAGTKFLQDMTFAGNGGTQATPPTWIPVTTGIYIDVTVAGGGTVGYTVLYRPR
jgi:hypothetical protein